MEPRAKKPMKCLLALALLLGLLVPQNEASSKSGPMPQAYGKVIRDTARITFEWPHTVYFTASTSGKNLTITFDRKANPDMGALLKQLNPYVTHVQRKADGKTLVLSLDKPYRIRTFVSDNINGIDLLDVNPKAQRRTMVAKAAPVTAVKAKKLEAAKAPAKKAKPVVVAASEDQAANFARLSPAAGEEEMAAQSAVAAAPAEVPPPAAAPAAVAEAAPPAVAPAAATPVEAPAVALPAASMESDTPAIPPGEMVTRAEPPSNLLKVNVSASDESAVLRLPFTERAALAVFTRNRHLWVVFNQTKPLDLSDFETLPRTVIGKAQWIKSSRASVLRMPIDDGISISMAREENSLEWAILLTSKKHAPMQPISVMVNVEPPAPPHVFVPVLDAAEPILLIDPQIGDQMIITPFYGLGQGLSTARDFVEFSLPKTAQGLAVVKKADEVTVAVLRNGLRVYMPKGATLTPALPEVKEERAGMSVGIATLFPYDLWKVEATTDKRLFTNALFHRIAESANSQEANDARLRLATFYLSEGMAPEALAFLEGINRTNPSYFRSTKLAALRGAAYFLMYRFVDAARDFSASELNNNKEMDYWRSMLGDLLGNSEESYNYLALDADYFSKYPPLLKQRLAIVAADRSIAAKEYNTALKIFDSLQKENQLDTISAYINFLLAKISAETGQEKEALEIWDKIAQDYKHPFVQANAEFARVIWGMNNGKIPKDEAANRLERLRLAWHGDGLELKVLTLLGELYLEKKDYVNAMRIWHGTIQSFPNSAIAIEMTRKMQEAFIAMFNEGIADQLPPLEALALYYEYRSYTPQGNTGDEMMERLADRLVTVDLLDQATALLDHQMKFQVEKEKRSRVGAKLASIHLLNHQPKKALAALQDSVYGENSLLLKMQRNRLTAQAMDELGQSDKALQALGQDNSAEAEHIRLSVYWRERDWPKVIESVEGTIKLRTDPTAPVTLDESESLIKLALAYVFQNDRQQLQYLRDYFSPLMAENPNREVFDFITSGDMVLTTRNFDEVVARMTQTRTFIESYKARIETAKLDEAPAPANP